MNIKINKNVITVLALSSVLGLSSCHSDLDRMPTNITTANQVYAIPLGIKQALAKVYGAYALPGDDVQGQNADFTDFVRSFFNLQELPTDEAICAWGDDGIRDFHNLTWSSSNPYIKGLFYRSIVQIKLANEFLKETANASNETVIQYRAEARFLRAFQYWVLIDVYGNPPFIAEDLGVGKVYPIQYKRAELFKYIESELKDIEATLLAPKANEYGRVDRAAAWALLARLYLNAEVYTGTARYADAATYAEKVISSGKYRLNGNYSAQFLVDNSSNPEAILTINYDGVKSQAYGGMTYLVNASANGDASKFLNVNWGVGGWGGNRATKALADLFDKNRDKRYLMGAEKPEISDVAKFGEGYWVYKFRNVTSSGSNGQHSTFADADFPLFRLAEMHLVYAEAAARGEADKAKGLAYINELRSRAGISPLAASQLTAQEVLNERGRELYWEGHRRTDLVRFNQLTTATYRWPWKGDAAEGRAVDNKYNIYPLPADDVQANPNLQQQSGY